MQKTKTIKDWFLQSKEPWAGEALLWMDLEKSNIPSKNLHSALNLAFVWGETYQGHNYWKIIHDTIKNDGTN